MNETEVENGNRLPVVPLASSREMTVENLQQALDVAEKFIEVLVKVKKIAIRLTNAHDWIDQNDIPYLQDTGCAAISKAFGIKLFNVTQHKPEEREDDKGKYIIVTTEGYGSWNNNEEHAIGTCSTRDKLYAMRDGELLPLSEVDLPNVKKKSHTNFHNRLIKKLLALSYTWKEVEEYSGGEITKAKCTSVTYDKGKYGGKQDTKEMVKQRTKLREMILALNGDDKESARKYLFAMTNSNEYKGKHTVDEIKSEKQLGFIYTKVLKEFNTLLDKQTAAADNKNGEPK